MRFETSPALFSPNAADKGTLAMLELSGLANQAKVLDLGCAWGLAGIFAAKLIGAENVFMSDISTEAVEISRRNATLNNVEGITFVHSDAFDEIYEKDFTLILSNPPYHADFSVAKRFIEKGFNRLTLGGALMMVTKRRDWYKNKLIAVFGGTEVTEAGGYYVFRAQKRSLNYANK
jgi:16S rRNA (guanine1207-N2)-methyltransferase